MSTITYANDAHMNGSINQHMGPVEIILLLTIALFWGGAFFFVEILLGYLPPLTIVTARVGLAAILLWAIVLIRGLERPKRLSYWGTLAVLGLLSIALPFCLITWAQTRIDSSIASVLNATAPLFVVLVAGSVLSDEHLTAVKVAGVIVGIVGVSVLIGQEALQGIGEGSALGQLAVVGASFSFAMAAVFSRRFAKIGISPMMVATGQLTTATLILLPLALLIDGQQPPENFPLSALVSLLGLAFLSTVLANVLYFQLITTAGATNAALVGFLMPVVATALGIAFLGETFTRVQIVGAGLIGLGLIVMDGRVVRRLASL